jgi:hypothetical protein
MTAVVFLGISYHLLFVYVGIASALEDNFCFIYICNAIELAVHAQSAGLDFQTKY